LAVLAVTAAAAATAAEPNLYDWLSAAPVVVLARVTNDSERYDEFEALRVARGSVPTGARFLVNPHVANRERIPNTDALRFETGDTFLLALTPSAKQKEDKLPRYDLLSGVKSARKIPNESVEPFGDAILALAEIQATHDDEKIFRAVRGLLEESNPLLVRTALELLLRYSRAEAADSARVRPLLDHPMPDIRELAARALGQILATHGGTDAQERAEVFGELAARARRDASAVVRVAATESVAASGAQGAEDVLREIARDDPDQSVRYVAERALYERRTDGTTPSKPN